MTSPGGQFRHRGNILTGLHVCLEEAHAQLQDSWLTCVLAQEVIPMISTVLNHYLFLVVP